MNKDITVIEADDPKKLRLGWVIYEEIGIGVINNYATNFIIEGSGEYIAHRQLNGLGKLFGVRKSD